MVALETDSRCPTCGCGRVKLMIRTFGDGDPPLLFQRCTDCNRDLSFKSRIHHAA